MQRHVDGLYLVLEDEKKCTYKYGPFSSHWAACAAMIRCSQPEFKSLGGDKESDLLIEAEIRKDRNYK